MTKTYTDEQLRRWEAELIIETCREDLIAYSKYIKEDYDVQPYHETIAEALEKVERWEIKRLALGLPPRAWKSKLACINFPSRSIGRNPYRRIVVAWYWKELPVEFSKETRNIVQSDKYQAIFQVWLETEQVAHRRTYSPSTKKRDPDKAWYYHATWVWWWLTWYWWDILIVDDPVKNREEAESLTYRKKVWDRYTSTLSTRFSDQNSALIVIMTRWHVDDLRWRIEKMSEQFQQAGIDQEPRTIIDIPALTRIEEVPHDAPETQKRQSFRPNRFWVEYLIRKKIEVWVRDFAALYQQNPIESTWAIFKPSDFRYAKLSDFEIKNWKEQPKYQKDHIDLRIVCDPAFSTDRDSDDAAIWVVWMHRITKDIFIFDVYAWTSAPSVTIDNMFNLCTKRENRWRTFTSISIEYVTINKDQMDFFKTIEQEMQIRNQRYKLHKFKPVWKKEDRIKYSLEPKIAAHKVYFLDDQIPYDQMQKILEQLQQFPHSTKKDVIDMISQAAIVLSNSWTTREKNKEPVKRTYVNRITGKEQIVW